MVSRKTWIIVGVAVGVAAIIGTVFVIRDVAMKSGPSSSKTPAPATKAPIPSPTNAAATLQPRQQAAVPVALAAATLRPSAVAPQTPAPVHAAPVGMLNSCGNNKYIALTFDDGPFAIDNVVDGFPATAHVLDELKASGLHATFFLSPGGQSGHYGPVECNLVRRALAEGHEVQWHTWTHSDLTLPTTNIDGEVQQCRDWIQSSCTDLALDAASDFSMLRPPFGYTNDHVNSELHKLGFTVALWNVDSQDWQGSSLEQIQGRIREGAGAAPSMVILMHDRWYHTGLIAWIKQQYPDHQFVTASQCYRACGSTNC